MGKWMVEHAGRGCTVDHAIRHVTIVGMGALGLLLADAIQRNLGHMAVDFLVDDERFERYRKRTSTVNGQSRKFTCTNAIDTHPADLVIIAVKERGLASALDEMARCVDSHTIIISVMNGIVSEQTIASRYGERNVIACVAQGMDAMHVDGALTYSHPGMVRFGSRVPEQDVLVDGLADFFGRAGIPFAIDEDITHRIWAKFMMNVGINQVCLAYGATYGEALAPGPVNERMRGAMGEVIGVAAAEGVVLTREDLDADIDVLATLDPMGRPSMGQDGLARRPSEVELFSGTMIRLAERHGMDVPQNRWLHDRIGKIEAAY